jgi:uroporphyrinogen-III synthase
LTDAAGRLPLAGKRIVVTRAPEQAAEFAAQLESAGAEAMLFPTVRFVLPDDTAALDRAVSELDKFDWLIFTSRNTVKFLASRFPPLGFSGNRLNRLLHSVRVAVIGSATNHEACSAGFLPAYEAQESRGEALAAELLEEVRGKRVLLPRSDRADPALPKMLREAGAEVVDIVAYRTVVPASLENSVAQAIRQGDVDVITLFSPSAYKNLADEIGLETLRRHSGKILLASIGPTTSSAIREDGLPVAIEAPSSSAAALCSAIADYFCPRAARGRIAP